MGSSPPKSQRIRHGVWRVVGVVGVLVAGVSFIILFLGEWSSRGSFENGRSATSTNPFALWANDLSDFTVSAQQEFRVLGARLSNLWQQSRPSAPPSIEPDEAKIIAQRLLERLAQQTVELDLARLETQLPPDWFMQFAVTAKASGLPVARLTVTRTQVCQQCPPDVACPAVPPEIRLSYYPLATALAAIQSANADSPCTIAPFATTTRYVIVDVCANSPACDNRAVVYAIVKKFFQNILHVNP